MGNRAYVVFTDSKRETISPAVYLHWHGGPESVYAYLRVLAARGGCAVDPFYQAARFAGIVAEHFGPNDCYSLGIEAGPASITAESMAEYDHGNNGSYVVATDGEGWEVRRFMDDREWPADKVKAEREAAQSSQKFEAIVASLDKSRATASA